MTGINPYAGGSQKFLNKINDASVDFNEDKVASFTYSFVAYAQLKRSLRDIYPKWGVYANTVFKHTPFSGNESSVYGVDGTFYLAGQAVYQISDLCGRACSLSCQLFDFTSNYGESLTMNTSPGSLDSGV